MDSWHSFPKVYALGHAAIRDILDGDVIVQEKIDGSQLSFGKDTEGRLWIRSRGRVFDIDAPDSMFELAAERVKEVATALTAGWTYRGEYLQKPQHNALKYDKAPLGNICLFDISTGAHAYASYHQVVDQAQWLGFDVTPLLYEGPGSELNAPALESMLNRPSYLGGQIEGIVVKNYTRFSLDGHVMMGKYVTEAFKEVHKREWTKANPTSGDVLDQLLEQYRTEARWHKAVQHLKEAGKCNGDPSDIGPLIHEIRKDFVNECKPEVQELLWDRAKKKIMDKVSHGAPEWYKKQLMEGMFNGQ